MHTTKYTIQQIMTTKHNRKKSCLKKVSYTTIYPLTTNIGLQFYLRWSVEPNKYPLFPKAWLIISQPSHHSLCCEILQNVLTIITYCKICNRTDHSNKTQQKTRNKKKHPYPDSNLQLPVLQPRNYPLQPTTPSPKSCHKRVLYTQTSNHYVTYCDITLHYITLHYKPKIVLSAPRPSAAPLRVINNACACASVCLIGLCYVL